MGGKVMTLRDIIASYREAALDRLQAEGFYNAQGRSFVAVQEEKKASQQVQTQEDLQQFQNQQNQGTFDNEALQNLIESSQ
jgi:virulence-associated protein VapD